MFLMTIGVALIIMSTIVTTIVYWDLNPNNETQGLDSLTNNNTAVLQLDLASAYQNLMDIKDHICASCFFHCDPFILLPVMLRALFSVFIRCGGFRNSIYLFVTRNFKFQI